MRLRSDGGSASSTGLIRKPKIGRAQTRPATPSTSTAMTTRSRRDLSSPRCSERLIRDWIGSSSAMRGGLALGAHGGARLGRGGGGGLGRGRRRSRSRGRRLQPQRRGGGSLRGDDALGRREDGGIGRRRQRSFGARGRRGLGLDRGGLGGWLDPLGLRLLLGEDLLVHLVELALHHAPD